MDKTVYDWLYHYWFRCEVEGIEHVPASGGALLVSNHSGALPPDAAMIPKAIKEEHPRPRPLHLTVEHFFKGYPGLQHAGGQDRRRARAPGQRAPPAARRGAARARLPRGPQGHGEALQGPLQAAPLRPRRLRGGRDARAGADRAGRGRRGGGGDADLRPHERAPAPHRAAVLPDHADVPALRAGRLPRLPAREVQDPLPRAHPDRPVGRGAVAGPRARSRRSPTRSAAASRRS